MSKENNIEQFDNLFKEKLSEASVKAPSGVFENVASQIGSGATGVGTTAVVGKTILVKIVAAIVVVTAATVAVVKSTSPDSANIGNREKVKVEEGYSKPSEEEKALKIEKSNVESSSIENSRRTNKALEELAVANDKVSPIANEEYNSAFNSNNDSQKGGTSTREPNTPEGKVVEIYSVEIENGSIIPLSLVLKEKYCIGEIVELSANGNTNAIWFLDGVKVGEGNKLSYQFRNTGKKKLEVKEKGSLLFESMLNVIGPNTSFETRTMNEGEFNLAPLEENATFVWNIGDNKGYQATNNEDLIIRDYVRARIPVTLVVETEEGCIDSIKQNVVNEYVVKGENPKMANVFTPGNDGFNDNFVVEIKHETYFNFVVKNRNGEIVFKSMDKEIQWDGKCNFVNCPMGLYTYTLLYKIEGSDELQFKNGTITLLE